MTCGFVFPSIKTALHTVWHGSHVVVRDMSNFRGSRKGQTGAQVLTVHLSQYACCRSLGRLGADEAQQAFQHAVILVAGVVFHSNGAGIYFNKPLQPSYIVP